jgi:putative membrane protein insertion efficiency factor
LLLIAISFEILALESQYLKAEFKNTQISKKEEINSIPITLLKFYQNNISNIDGQRCRMNPTCSRYSIHSYKKHGLFLGTILTFDRLLHEGNEYMFSKIIYDYKSNVYRVDDPVENNTFWLFKNSE